MTRHGLLGQELHLVPNENTVEGLVAVGELRRPDGSTLDPEAVLEANRAYGQTGDGIAEEAEALFARAKTGGQRAWKDKWVAAEHLCPAYRDTTLYIRRNS